MPPEDVYKRQGVYVVGDAWQGPSTVVKAIRDAKAAAEAILGKTLAKDFADPLPEEEIISRRGILKTVDESHEAHRCLNCQMCIRDRCYPRW